MRQRMTGACRPFTSPVFLTMLAGTLAVSSAVRAQSDADAEPTSRAIDTADWPGHVARFNGPGDVYELADAVVAYLREEDPAADLTDAKPILAAVRGDWSSRRQDALGQTTQWALPVVVAYEMKPGDDTVHVYEVLMLTEEKEDVGKAPPFAAARFDANYPMRRSNLPTLQRRPDPQSALMWFLLVLGNLLAGFLAARPLLEAKIPSLANLYQALSPHSWTIGLAVLCIGTVSLLESLVALAPISNILPILSAILAAKMLCAEAMLRAPRVSQAERFGAPSVEDANQAEEPEATSVGVGGGPAERAGRQAGMIAKHVRRALSDHRSKIDAATVPVGLTAMVLGVLHLLIGGVVLF